MIFFVTDGCIGTVTGIDNGIIGQGEYFFLYHLHQQSMASGGEIAAPHTALEDEVPANHEIVGSAVQGDASIAVSRGVEHLQALCSEAHLIALVEELGGSGHIIHGESERHGVSIRFVINGHAGLMTPYRRIELTGTPVIARNMINVRMCVHNTYHLQLVCHDIFLELRILVALTIAGIHNKRLASVVMQHQRVHLNGIEMKDADGHVSRLLCQIAYKIC